MEPEVKPRRMSTAKKILVVAAVCAFAAAGGVFAAVAPGFARGALESEAASAVRSAPGLASPVVAPVKVDITPADAAKQVNPATPVSVTVGNGRIESVTLTSTSGEAVEGAFAADGSSWTATAPLKFNTEYSYTYVVTDSAGRETTATQSFNTVSSTHEADAAIYPLDGMKVGVGQPLQVVFSEPVLNREAVEKAITITSSAGQAGAFHWFSDTMVRYRPEAFWAANSTVTMDMKLFGVDLGNGQIANFNKKANIRFGDKKVAIADAAAHTFTLSVNDQVVKTLPVSMGDKRFPSARGYAVLMEKNRYDHFRAASIGLKPGDPAYYGNVDVEYAIRLTLSGAYIHQALESAYPFIGNTNVSHGCIGFAPDGAAWVFDNMTTGDVVQIINTEGDYAAVDDGYGDWNIPWAEYDN
ncbi:MULTISPECIES: L,D-transpeptidase [Pseudarthrobacter]|uniref:L,D-transpeptidase n=1 Tax=Pseudarthrobacter TaxID=1742993 RepID=UPI00168B001B|nr:MULTISPECIES: Ig-like domain-containing protein [Pseudarthrobacter]MDP9998090.1 lipoprotein-anchoring transpeptidase ErfK/SrfK [Pseudarthrobacter sulfonivorans]QOD04549.1 L,D-transpeptidase [Pseudarthrobacter sp. BIM B-2242]